MQVKPISKVKKVEYPKEIIFFDTESNIGELDEDNLEAHTFKLGVAIYVKLDINQKIKDRMIYHFYSTQDFWNFVSKFTHRDKTLYIFAHNIKYDLINSKFLEGLAQIDFTPEYPIMAGHFIMTATNEKIYTTQEGKEIKKKKKIIFCDTHNYIRDKLENIGKKVGITKGVVDFLNSSTKELIEYCQTDVEIIEKFIVSLIQFLFENNLGSLKLTLASTAFNAWRYRFNSVYSPVYYHDNPALIEFERNAYKGGRVECFFIGEKREKIYYLDINSMYPFVMQNYELPSKPIINPQHLDSITVNSLPKIYFIAECILDIPSSEKLNPYPYRSKDGKLLFPNGKFKTFLHDAELRYAIENNHLKEITYAVGYEKNYSLKNYVDFFYPLKSNAPDETTKMMIKLFLNSLYGRFGMRHPETDSAELPADTPRRVLGNISVFNMDGKREVYHIWNNRIYRSYYVRDYPRKNINVALAGAVTSYSRMLLFGFIKQAGEGNIFYCDTDSVFVNQKGYDNLVNLLDEKEIGKLKLEDTTEYLKVNAPKNYIFGKKVRSKGIPLTSELEGGIYRFYRFTTIKDYINSGGQDFGRKRVHKELKLEYTKGIVLNNGQVNPITLDI